MIKFNIHLEDKKIERATLLIQSFYNNGVFLSRVEMVDLFQHTLDSGLDVAKKLQTANLSIEIRPYKTLNPWSKVIGHAEGNTIWVNTRKLHLPVLDRSENIMHEILHLLGYSHDGNSNSAYNRNTVPYKVALIFKLFLKDYQYGH